MELYNEQQTICRYIYIPKLNQKITYIGKSVFICATVMAKLQSIDLDVKIHNIFQDK